MRKLILIGICLASLLNSCKSNETGFSLAELQEQSKIVVSPDSLLTPEQIKIKHCIANDVYGLIYENLSVNDNKELVLNATKKDFIDKGVDVRWYYTFVANIKETNKALKGELGQYVDADDFKQQIEKQKADYFAAEDKTELFKVDQSALNILWSK